MAKQKIDKMLIRLRELPPKELQNLMRKLFKEELYKPPTLESINEEAERIVEDNGLPLELVDEAIKWAKSQK